ncbi:hypothetical protein GCM10010266_31750 [Streptomyces griseomycini]|nr:hypothetical protein GCM10010266_31750 [Streptomyces griseomycini]GGR21314.1 hypothetical protein GCM10015536_28690 [Streptomyces griseomycini]
MPVVRGGARIRRGGTGPSPRPRRAGRGDGPAEAAAGYRPGPGQAPGRTPERTISEYQRALALGMRVPVG